MLPRITSFTCFLLVTVTSGFGQVQSNKMGLRYTLTQKTLEKLEKDSVYLTNEAQKIKYQICELDRFKFFIAHKEHKITVDSWELKAGSKGDERTAKLKACRADRSTIDPNTPNPLRIDLPPRPKVGDPTVRIALPYQAWLLQVVSLGLKVRPSVEDYRDSTYANNVITGSLNLGISVGHSYGWGHFTHRSFHTFSITPSFGFGFSSASLAKEPLKDQINVALAPSNFILSPNFSVIFGRNDIGIILAGGVDMMTGIHADSWAYQGKPFWGLGIAAGLKL